MRTTIRSLAPLLGFFAIVNACTGDEFFVQQCEPTHIENGTTCSCADGFTDLGNPNAMCTARGGSGGSQCVPNGTGGCGEGGTAQAGPQGVAGGGGAGAGGSCTADGCEMPPSTTRFRMVAPGLPVSIEAGGNCVDVADASKADGAAINMRSCHYAKNQQYFFIPVQSVNRSSSQYEYEIRTAHGARCLEDRNGTLVQGNCVSNGTHWYVQTLQETSVQLKNVDTQRCASPLSSAGSVSMGVCSALADPSSSPFALKLIDSDSLVMRPKHSARAGMCVNVANAVTEHAWVQQYPCTGTANER